MRALGMWRDTECTREGMMETLVQASDMPSGHEGHPERCYRGLHA